MRDEVDTWKKLIMLNAALVMTREKAEDARAKLTRPAMTSRRAPSIAAKRHGHDFGGTQGGGDARQRQRTSEDIDHDGTAD